IYNSATSQVCFQPSGSCPCIVPARIFHLRVERFQCSSTSLGRIPTNKSRALSPEQQDASNNPRVNSFESLLESLDKRVWLVLPVGKDPHAVVSPHQHSPEDIQACGALSLAPNAKCGPTIRGPVDGVTGG